MNEYFEDRKEQGFTLIELLIAIVVVGILAAVAIVGIAGLTNTGSKSACTQSLDGAKAASAAFYANNNNTWPTTLESMATVSAAAPVNSPAVYEDPAGATYNAAVIAGPPAIAVGNQMTVGTWHLTMTPNATTGPTFACS